MTGKIQAEVTGKIQAEVTGQQFGRLLQNSFNEIYLFDAASLYFILSSKGAERNSGYSDDELRHLTFFDLAPSFNRENFERLIAPLHTDGQQTFVFETEYLRKDGTTYPVDVNLQLMESDYPVYVVIIQDITERKNANMELDKSRKLLRELVVKNDALREEERKHIAREIHDELGQLLTALRMNVSLLRIQFGEQDAALLEKIKAITVLLDQSIQCVRNVVANLRPAALDMGVVPAIRWLCDEFIKRTGTPCILTVPKEEIHLDETLAIAAFRVVQESLTNVARYAEASKVEIDMRQDADNFSVLVKDNGKGFDYIAASNRKSFGLLGMRERAIALWGAVNIYSAPQQGTQILFVVPHRKTAIEETTTDTQGAPP
jgi:PAS domain S-box-containing protein